MLYFGSGLIKDRLNSEFRTFYIGFKFLWVTLIRLIIRSSGKHQEENRSSTPIPFEDSFSNTTIFESFSETRSVTSGDVTLTEGVNMSSDEVGLASDTVQPSAGDLIPIISQQVQSQVLSMEERLLSRISTMLESQWQDIPDFPNEMPPRSRGSRGVEVEIAIETHLIGRIVILIVNRKIEEVE